MTAFCVSEAVLPFTGRKFEILGVEIEYTALRSLIDTYYIGGIEGIGYLRLQVRESPDSGKHVNERTMTLTATIDKRMSKLVEGFSKKGGREKFLLGTITHFRVNEKLSNVLGLSQAFDPIGDKIYSDIFRYVRESLGAPYDKNQKSPEETMPQKPLAKGNLDLWFDYYHAMKKAKQKYTFEDMAKDVGLTSGYLRQLHGPYKSSRTMNEQ